MHQADPRDKPTAMQAVFLHGNRKATVASVPVPSIKPGEVLVRVHAMGVCGTDLEIYHGDMFYFTSGLAEYPVIPGHEWSGEVVEVGEHVVGLSEGDRVVGETTIPCCICAMCKKGRINLCPNRKENGILHKHGSAAQYMSYPAHALHKFSSEIPYESACLIEPAAVSYRGVAKLRLQPDDRVAVVGAGTIGLLCVQMAKLFGAKSVVLVDYHSNRLQLGKQLGADHLIDLKETPNRREVGPFDAIIEASGHPAAVKSLFDMAAPAARICLLGLCGSKAVEIDLDKTVTNDMELFGSLGSPGVWGTVVDLLESGKIRTQPLISHRFAIHELEHAFTLMEQRDPDVIKIILNHDV